MPISLTRLLSFLLLAALCAIVSSEDSGILYCQEDDNKVIALSAAQRGL